MATENVVRNGLQDRIAIITNPDPNKIFILDDATDYTFSMCNPPFYSSEEEIQQGLLNKELEPSAVSYNYYFFICTSLIQNIRSV